MISTETPFLSHQLTIGALRLLDITIPTSAMRSPEYIASITLRAADPFSEAIKLRTGRL
jgi:hypothetical protein